MAKYKPHDYGQTVLLPIDYSRQLLPGTFEHSLNYLVDHKIDLGIFDKRFRNDDNGAPAWDPAVMLKIIFYGYSKGILSSRDLAEACRTNIIFKALSANSEPHFTTIAEFISQMKDEILSIFVNILMVCSELNLIGGETFALDGCKLSSNAAKEWSGTIADLRKKKEKFEERARLLLEKHRANDQDESMDGTQNDKAARQIERIRKKAEKIERFLQENEERVGKRGRENQSNITDNESAKIQSAKGVIQGYNGLAVADAKNQIVVSAEAFGSGQEGQFLPAMVEKTRLNLRLTSTDDGTDLKGRTFLADTNYFSEDNLEYLAGEEIDAVVPDQQFRKRDPRFATQARHKPERAQFTQKDFTYDPKENHYVCPGGKTLLFKGERVLGVAHGRSYAAKQGDCRVCELRGQCLRTAKVERRTLFIVDEMDRREFSDRMRRRIDTEEGRDLYSKRMGIIEPVFADITHCKGMDRFTLRGKVKVNIQWLLYCMVHNIGKIVNSGALVEV